MSVANKKVTLSLKVMINRERNKVLFAEADNHFADILLSFLTLPLGRVMKVLEKQYGDKAPSIGSLTTLYHSLANLDNSHFVKKDAKESLLDPTTSFEREYNMLKLGIISDSSPAESAHCPKCRSGRISADPSCRAHAKAKKRAQAANSSDGVFTLHGTSFIISYDLQIFPNDKGLFGVIALLGITDMDEAEPITVNFGFTEILKLLKASLTSSTPLSDVVLNKTTPLKHSAAVQSQLKIAKEEERDFVSLKVMRQKSTGKFLYAEAKEKFLEFLFSLLLIPLGGAEHLVLGKTCFKAVNNLFRSTSQLIDSKYFKTATERERLIKLNLSHQINANGERNYLSGSRTYEVTDDLTVRPFCMFSIMSTLKRQEVPISDVEEVELQIGSQKGLSIMFASLTSTTALSDALLIHTHKPNKRPKREV